MSHLHDIAGYGPPISNARAEFEYLGKFYVIRPETP